MAFQSVPETAEAVVRWQSNGEVCTMTFFGRYGEPYDQTAIDGLALQMDDWATDELKVRLSDQVTYLGVNVKGLEFQEDLEAENVTGAGVGGLEAAPMPNNVVKAIKRYTGRTGRSARGRVYWPLVTSQVDSTDENRASASETAVIVAALNEVRTYMDNAGWNEVVVSRQHNGVVRTEGETYVVQAYLSTSDVLNTQRRRLPRT
jgi:hypothetical protein